MQPLHTVQFFQKIPVRSCRHPQPGDDPQLTHSEMRQLVNPGHQYGRRTARYHRTYLILWIGLLFLIPACNLFGPSENPDATRVALMVQQTDLAGTMVALTQLEEYWQTSPIPLQPTSPATQQVVPPTAIELPAPEVTPESSTSTLDRHIKAAKILVHENMSASGYERYVLSALDQGDYFYVDVGSATGWFKTQLLSNQEWDLVIAAVEAERDFGGDFFVLIDDQVAKGVSAIVEYWNFDAAPNGMQDSLFRRCGVEFHSNWYLPDLRVFYWLQPDHPLFNQPNRVTSLRNAAVLWKEDVGDLLRIRTRNGKPTGDAVILASTDPMWTDDHGTLVSCLGGRVILQTFRSHEYQSPDMIRLWQNYIYNTLKARFTVGNTNAPTPVVTFDPPQVTGTPIPGGGVPQPGTEFRCGGAFTVQLLSEPVLQKSLFEHHASGTFLLADLQLKNLTSFPIQIWDGDYSVEGRVDNRPLLRGLHKAATGYLFINKQLNLVQDAIAPGATFSVALAFDVPTNGIAWNLVLRPGFEYKEQVCEVRIPLTH